MQQSFEKIRETIHALPPAGKYYSYGTAGFRDKYTASIHIVFVKVGILAALRSLTVNGQAIGVMITASHNPKEDNGVKIVDPDGGMLTQSWEKAAEILVNANTVDEYLQQLTNFVKEKEIQPLSTPPLVIIGADCRDHSPILSEFVKKGIELVSNGVCHHIGECTTPLLHYVVAAVNQDSSFSIQNEFLAQKYIQAYFDDLFIGFTELVQTTEFLEERTHKQPLILDTAYGVGSVTTNQFLHYIESKGGLPQWELEIRNAVGEGPVNENSGAEHCQKLQIPCEGVSAEKDHNQLLCSFDGDADRIVFHAFTSNQPSDWVLLDGDRIATLIGQFLYTELQAAELLNQLDLGIVQTAYANGSSTHYLKNRGLTIHITKTGVKFLHHKAHELDIGIYFEANGHGTVLFSHKFRELLAEETKKASTEYAHQPRRLLALRRLQASLRVVNPTVGDALSDLLFSLGILTILGMSYEDWIQIYSELPSKQVKVAVPDKSRLVCSEDETYLLSPQSLQEQLNVLMNSVSMGRIFIRPSGTEDVVRIYAEATQKEDVEVLVAKTKELIHQFYAN